MWWMCTWTTSAPKAVQASSCPSTTASLSCLPLLASSSASLLVYSSSSLAEPSRFITTDVDQKPVEADRRLDVCGIQLFSF